jgi:hypothetical protein
MYKMSNCKTCKSYKKGYCKLKNYKVSINSNFCDSYNLKWYIKALRYLNRHKWFIILVGLLYFAVSLFAWYCFNCYYWNL